MAIDTLIINPNPQPMASQQTLRFIDFSAFLAWVSTHWHDQQALQHAQWLISPFVSQAHRRQNANVWRTAAWVVPTSTDQFNRVAPEALRWLDAEGARRLLEVVEPQGVLTLSGLTDMDVATAQVLANHAGTLDLSGLRQLPPEVSMALSAHQGLIHLDGLSAIGGSLAPLVRRRGPRGSAQPGLSLGGLSRLDAVGADLLTQVQGDLILNGLTQVTEQQAQWLAQRKGDSDKKLGTLHLDSWHRPSPAALAALSAYKGPLSLGTWVPGGSGEPDCWDALSKASRESLSLGAVTALSEPNAKALANLDLKRLYLPGVLQLDALLIEHLGNMVLQRLSLDGVTHASAAQIRRLVQLQHKDSSTSGLSMANLVLTPEVKAELMRHKKLLDPLYDRVYAGT
jgi:hypothetical protein